MSAIAIFSYYSHRMIRFSLDNIAILLKAYLQYQWNVQDLNSNVQNGDTIAISQWYPLLTTIFLR